MNAATRKSAENPPKPDWLRVRAGCGKGYTSTARLLRESGLHTVCEEALCPNRGTCWEHGRATIMILGDLCTRGCAFCGVTAKPPMPPDQDEPRRVAAAVRRMALRDVVITSVTRDDLADGGAALWAETIRLVREASPATRVEALVPDFAGSDSALRTVLDAGPAILGHNLETVPSLYAKVRPGASYRRSLDVIAGAHGAGSVTKTALMLGLGETPEEVVAVMRDARHAGCDIFFAGQYLRPSACHTPVVEYVRPDVFEEYRRAALSMGFAVAVTGPLVRSSYHSPEQDAFLDAGPRRSGRNDRKMETG
ncbi:MAG: lipoyl synthase [Lentisphaerae bacterium]|nr:lipoyl synthase [Lentisphaerota bacterium]